MDIVKIVLCQKVQIIIENKENIQNPLKQIKEKIEKVPKQVKETIKGVSKRINKI